MGHDMRGLSDLWQQTRWLRYLMVGAANTAFAYLVYALGLLFGLSVPLASLVSLLIGIIVSFATQGSLVFGHLSPLAFVRFVLNWLAMYLIYVGLVLGLMAFEINPYLGGLAALVVTTTISFITLKRLVFRPPGSDDAAIESAVVALPRSTPPARAEPR